jgi:hypothetical protein
MTLNSIDFNTLIDASSNDLFQEIQLIIVMTNREFHVFTSVFSVILHGVNHVISHPRDPEIEECWILDFASQVGGSKTISDFITVCKDHFNCFPLKILPLSPFDFRKHRFMSFLKQHFPVSAQHSSTLSVRWGRRKTKWDHFLPSYDRGNGVHKTICHFGKWLRIQFMKLISCWKVFHESFVLEYGITKTSFRG